MCTLTDLFVVSVMGPTGACIHSVLYPIVNMENDESLEYSSTLGHWVSEQPTCI